MIDFVKTSMRDLGNALIALSDSELLQAEVDRLMDFNSLKDARDGFERLYLKNKLAVCGNNISKTARLIGVERSNLHKKMRELGINNRENRHD